MGKGDRRIWTRYTDLEPSAGKITRFLRAPESIGDDKRHWFKDEDVVERSTVSLLVMLFNILTNR